MFSPVVSMTQNLLPFEMGDLGQIESKAQYFKMFLLRLSQTYTFKRSQGLIFLTEYAKQKVLKVTGQIECDQVIIPHGLNSRFIGKKKIQLPLSSYSAKNPMRLIYVSNIDAYKHQSEVLKACGILIDKGYPIELTFIGPGSIRAVNDLNVQISKLNTTKKWSQYLGVFKYLDLPDAYEKADIGIFASSCETFGIILLEKMASGLPIAAANRSCIPELLGKGAIFFDPQNPSSISDAIEQYLLSDTLRTEKIKISHDLAIKYSWEKSSDMTFKFFKKIALAGKE
jgi:glycosyltransferase involved in cell wall biosynthesis